MSAVCEVHPAGKHRPTSVEDQAHHVVPRHWQQVWQPPEPWPYPGTFTEFGASQLLWDARTILVPPTCHRNLHSRLVLVMKRLGSVTDALGVPAVHAAGQWVAKALGIRDSMARQEMAWTLQSPLRWLEAGGDLRTLIAAKAWGEA